MIRISELVHEYIKRDNEGNPIDAFNAVDGVSLNVKRGEFIVIAGHNGSGKSTLARHINALLYPTEGEVSVDGITADDVEKVYRIRQKAGMVFQNPDNQIVSSVVEEDVAFGPENLGIQGEELRKRVDDALKAVGMYHYRHHLTSKLSGGQKQRVAIAGVLAMKGECVILDEATSMLDPEGREDVLNIIMELKKQGMTVILITHYMDEALMADRVFVMSKGKLVMEGTPQEIFSRKDEIISYRLELPHIVKQTEKLRAKGYQLPAVVLNEDELVRALRG